MSSIWGYSAMANTLERRGDFLTSEHIAHALRLASQYGYDRARRHMEQSGVSDELARHMLLIRYDRRGASGGNRAHAARHDTAP